MWFTGDSNPDNRHRPLLRVRRERPCDCRAAERRDKLTADYHVLRNDVALDLCAALISSDRRRFSALSNSLTRPLRSAISFVRPRARMLSSATKKEPSPLTIARPLIARSEEHTSELQSL